MILILSSDSDPSTTSVLLWLQRMEVENFIKINPYNITDFQYILQNDIFSNKVNKIDLNKINVVWYRRHKFVVNNILSKISEPNLKYTIYNNIEQEKRSLNQFLFYALKRKTWFTHPDCIRITKLIQLKEAKNTGLDIPETIFTQRKQDILDFKKKHNNVIVKPIDNPLFISLDEQSYFMTLTQQLDGKTINDLLEKIFSSLVQERIEKRYEIRAFYMNGDFYCMAIFSQQNQLTSLDYRNGSYTNLIRKVPYKLPDNIEVKLRLLMNKLNLNNGSIDLIRSKNDKYIFLEVNPVGQFGMVSIPCNYYLEKKIAEHLIKLNK